MKTKICLCALLCIAATVLTKAQSPVSGITASYQYPQLTQVQLAGMDALQLQMERIALTINVGISDPQDISKILVLVGSTEGSSDVLYKEFEYGSAGVFSDGTSYSSSGNGAVIGLGTYTGIEHYYVEAAAILEDGSQSASVRLIVQ